MLFACGFVANSLLALLVVSYVPRTHRKALIIQFIFTCSIFFNSKSETFKAVTVCIFQCLQTGIGTFIFNASNRKFCYFHKGPVSIQNHVIQL